VTEQENPVKNCTSDELARILGELSMEQIRWIIARQEHATDKEAAEAIGVSVRTVYNWPDTVKEAARLMAADGLIAATHIRRRHLAKAMAVKVAGLDSDDERLRQGVATEVIEWEMGRATQPQTHSGPDGKPIEIADVSPREQIASRLAGIAARERTDGDTG